MGKVIRGMNFQTGKREPDPGPQSLTEELSSLNDLQLQARANVAAQAIKSLRDEHNGVLPDPPNTEEAEIINQWHLIARIAGPHIIKVAKARVSGEAIGLDQKPLQPEPPRNPGAA